ncbi:MAG: hypothetical protein NTU53_22300 [Planctomycetota bacterium]|nr:hypothetical protein [Planctomycetota bacterium]
MTISEGMTDRRGQLFVSGLTEEDYVLGLTEQQTREFFSGPAHLPWHRMANIDHWQGPLPMSYVDHQLVLQKKILERQRQLGMTPVLPAFAGHVPLELKDVHPEANVKPLGEWAGFSKEYATYFLDPLDPLFSKIQKAYLTEQTREFGTDHIYGIASRRRSPGMAART